MLSGPVGAGKSTLGRKLADRYDAVYVRTQELMRNVAATRAVDLAAERRAMQDFGDVLDRDTGGSTHGGVQQINVERMLCEIVHRMVEVDARLCESKPTNRTFPTSVNLDLFCSIRTHDVLSYEAT